MPFGGTEGNGYRGNTQHVEDNKMSDFGKERRLRSTHTLSKPGLVSELVQKVEMRRMSQKITFVAVGQERLYDFVRSKYFSGFITFMVCMNALFIGVETDRVELGQEKTEFWYRVELFFATVFLTEVILRLWSERCSFFRDGWNIFDFSLVSLALVDTFVLSYFLDQSQLGAFSVLRILRLARLARILRLLRFFKELWLLVAGILDAMRTLAWAWFLILLIIYIFGVFTTRMLGHEYADVDPLMEEYFGTVGRSMFTLFQAMTTEGWADITRESMVHEEWTPAFFVVYLSITTYAISNVVVAVIVENTLTTAVNHKDDVMKKQEAEKDRACTKIYEVFHAADVDGDGELTKVEFIKALDNHEVSKSLNEVGLDLRQAHVLFDILDYDKSGALDAEEFIEGLMKARGEAKAQDVLAVQCDVWRAEERVCEKLHLGLEVARSEVKHIKEGQAKLSEFLTKGLQNVEDHQRRTTFALRQLQTRLNAVLALPPPSPTGLGPG